MAKIISISTKKGDKGESYLANGKKFPKDHGIFEVLGSIDELNAHIGLCVASLRDLRHASFLEQAVELEIVQKHLYTLSAILAGAEGVGFDLNELERIEMLGNQLQEKMAEGWTTQFVYPGGSVTGAHLDIARTVCRRVERVIVHFVKEQLQEKKAKNIVFDTEPKHVGKYLNRLSDHLFIVRCFVNSQLGVVEKKFTK